MEQTEPNINIYYEKNPLYRSIYSDGLIGGITPGREINLNFYATRNCIPKSVTHKINPDGTLSSQGKNSEDSKVGIIREVEIGIYMTKDTAEEIYDFLHKILEKP